MTTSNPHSPAYNRAGQAVTTVIGKYHAADQAGQRALLAMLASRDPAGEITATVAVSTPLATTGYLSPQLIESCLAALRLWSAHQRGMRAGRAHRPGLSIGASTAVSRRNTGKSDRRLAMLQACASASTLQGLTQALDRVIGAMQESGMGTDYGLLADQIAGWSRSQSRRRSTQRWARDFAASHAAEETP